jgi:hypothetical protein
MLYQEKSGNPAYVDYTQLEIDDSNATGALRECDNKADEKEASDLFRCPLHTRFDAQVQNV